MCLGFARRSSGPLARVTVLLSLLAGTSSCYLFNPNTDPPSEVEHCHAGVSGGEKPKTRAVALGEGRGSAFERYQEGSSATFVTGGQGLTMVTPVVRVAAESGDPSETCFLVGIISEFAGSGGGSGGGGAGGSGGSGGATGSGAGGSGASGSGEGGSTDPLFVTYGAKMKLDGDYFYTDGVIYNPVDWDRVKLTLTVTGEDFEGTSAVTVVSR